jgi:membrane-bound lytic murein transglycosylase B
MHDAVASDAARIEARYGVPSSILLAIWGNETNFGTFMGNFDLPRSLATLAYDGRRRALFEGEFIALLKMVDQGVPRSRLTGSWAGAFGNPQFLPSVYLRVAQDGDGDGFRDIWTNRADTLASIAGYFAMPDGVRASPGGEGHCARQSQPRCLSDADDLARMPARPCPPFALAHRGRMAPVGSDRSGPHRRRRARHADRAGRAGKTAFLLTGNYRVILDYNCSNYYALSVGWLADEIAGTQ